MLIVNREEAGQLQRIGVRARQTIRVILVLISTIADPFRTMYDERMRLYLGILVLLIAIPTFAQTATVTGYVFACSEAGCDRIPDATVSLTCTSSSVHRSTQSGGNGSFALSASHPEGCASWNHDSTASSHVG